MCSNVDPTSIETLKSLVGSKKLINDYSTKIVDRNFTYSGDADFC